MSHKELTPKYKRENFFNSITKRTRLQQWSKDLDSHLSREDTRDANNARKDAQPDKASGKRKPGSGESALGRTAAWRQGGSVGTWRRRSPLRGRRDSETAWETAVPRTPRPGSPSEARTPPPLSRPDEAARAGAQRRGVFRVAAARGLTGSRFSGIFQPLVRIFDFRTELNDSEQLELSDSSNIVPPAAHPARGGRGEPATVRAGGQLA